jgi:hypothetical protein
MRVDFDSKLSTIQTSMSNFGASTLKKGYIYFLMLQNCDLISIAISMAKCFWSTCFLQALLVPTFEKLQQNEKKNTTISMCILFCQMLAVDSQIMRVNSTTTYLLSNYIWGYRSPMIILFPFPTYALIKNWYPRIGYFPNKPNVRIWN